MLLWFLGTGEGGDKICSDRSNANLVNSRRFGARKKVTMRSKDVVGVSMIPIESIVSICGDRFR